MVDGWRNEAIGDLGTVVTGKTPSTKEPAFWNGEVPFITPPDLRGGRIRNAQRTITKAGLAEVSVIPRGAVMVCCIGSIGLTGICDAPAAATNQQINSVVVDESRTDARFLHYAIIYNRPAIQGAARITTVPILNKSNFSRIRVALPQLAEQRQIAAVLSAVQRAIERQERLIALTAELKKALMHKLFTEGTRGEKLKQTEIGPVPESWDVVPLEQLTESFQYGTSVKCGYDVQGSPVLRIPNVVGGHLNVMDLKFGKPKKNEVETVRLRKNDLLFVRTNGVRENAGRCSMYRGELGDACYFASYLIRARLRPGLSPEFLEEYTRTDIGVRLLAGRAARTADGKFNINTGTLETLLVPKPDADEQKLIANALASVDTKKRTHIASKRILEALFRTLLHQLMTAQVRVHDLDLVALDEAPPTAELVSETVANG